MNLSGFEKAKNIADIIQENTGGTPVNNPLGTEYVNSPIDDDVIFDFNRGVDAMTSIGNYHAIPESIFDKFKKKTKTTKAGHWRPDMNNPDFDPNEGGALYKGTGEIAHEINEKIPEEKWRMTEEQKSEIEMFDVYRKNEDSMESLAKEMYPKHFGKNDSDHNEKATFKERYSMQFVEYLKKNRPEHYKFYLAIKDYLK